MDERGLGDVLRLFALLHLVCLVGRGTENLLDAAIFCHHLGKLQRLVARIKKGIVPRELYVQWDSSQLERKEDKSETLVFHASNPNRKLRWSHFAPAYLSFEDIS
ncbi:hypothetical protein L596_017187 [Steinernema carpocapsae]|uniref:Uncharacterized protein n=1 Tax=Steinernema carpocapsae TaxID=34508 RepID=A0A4U5N130_STECR|nr:hypothetical protein L596_017187 [Steinernema carpocapsae]